MAIMPVRIAEVAGRQAILVGDRMPGYRAELVKTLIDVIRIQNEDLSDRARQERVRGLVEALGTKVVASGGGSKKCG